MLLPADQQDAVTRSRVALVRFGGTDRIARGAPFVGEFVIGVLELGACRMRARRLAAFVVGFPGDGGVTGAGPGVGGVTDVVTDGRDALVIPADDVAAQVRALARLLDDDALRLRLTAAARRRVAAFSLETMIAATEGVYRDVLQPA